MLEYALLIVVLTVIYNMFVFLRMNSLKNKIFLEILKVLSLQNPKKYRMI